MKTASDHLEMNAPSLGEVDLAGLAARPKRRRSMPSTPGGVKVLPPPPCSRFGRDICGYLRLFVVGKTGVYGLNNEPRTLRFLRGNRTP